MFLRDSIPRSVWSGVKSVVLYINSETVWSILWDKLTDLSVNPRHAKCKAGDNLTAFFLENTNPKKSIAYLLDLLL